MGCASDVLESASLIRKNDFSAREYRIDIRIEDLGTVRFMPPKGSAKNSRHVDLSLCSDGTVWSL